MMANAPTIAAARRRLSRRRFSVIWWASRERRAFSRSSNASMRRDEAALSYCLISPAWSRTRFSHGGGAVTSCRLKTWSISESGSEHRLQRSALSGLIWPQTGHNSPWMANCLPQYRQSSILLPGVVASGAVQAGQRIVPIWPPIDIAARRSRIIPSAIRLNGILCLRARTLAGSFMLFGAIS
jgi:hypothetical protein